MLSWCGVPLPGSGTNRITDLASETGAPLRECSAKAGEETASACPRAHRSSKPRRWVLSGGAEFSLAGFEGRREHIAVICAADKRRGGEMRGVEMRGGKLNLQSLVKGSSKGGGGRDGGDGGRDGGIGGIGGAGGVVGGATGVASMVKLTLLRPDPPGRP